MIIRDGTAGAPAAHMAPPPWTVMMPDGAESAALIRHSLHRPDILGMAEVVLFTGHFADELLAMIDRIAAQSGPAGSRPAGQPRRNRRLSPDHAGLFETTLPPKRIAFNLNQIEGVSRRASRWSCCLSSLVR